MLFLDREEWVRFCSARWYVSGNHAIDRNGRTRAYWNKNAGEGKIYKK